jgi:feruloyl-CoA synthase
MTAVKELAAEGPDATPDEILRAPSVAAFVRERLAAHNRTAGGSSARIARIMLMTEPPSIDGHEITDKGYVNQRATLERRATLVDALYAAEPPPDVIAV